MDPIVIVEGCGDRDTTWTHIINVEDLAYQHRRSVAHLMAYLRIAMVSARTYENRIVGAFSTADIKAALATLTKIDYFIAFSMNFHPR